MRRVVVMCPLLPAVLALTGCGGSDFQVAPVSGVVLCEGEPVPNAQVYFLPQMIGNNALTGKTGYAVADSLGNFTMTTYEPGDGAVVGKHKVRVERPRAEEFPDFDCNCIFATEQDLTEVEVKAGELNDITLELTIKPKNYRPSASELRDLDDARDDAE